MVCRFRRFVVMALLGCGIGLGAMPAQAAPAMPGLPLVQPVQYYARGVPLYGYGRPYYARPYPRYEARRFYHRPPPRFYGRPYEHYRFEGRGYDRHRFYR